MRLLKKGVVIQYLSLIHISLAGYMGTIRMHVVNLLPIQEEIVKNCPEEETTLLVRRFMMRIAESIAVRKKDMMLITGEDLGQVASQTAEALVVTDSVVKIDVYKRQPCGHWRTGYQ